MCSNLISLPSHWLILGMRYEFQSAGLTFCGSRFLFWQLHRHIWRQYHVSMRKQILHPAKFPSMHGTTPCSNGCEEWPCWFLISEANRSWYLWYYQEATKISQYQSSHLGKKSSSHSDLDPTLASSASPRTPEDVRGQNPLPSSHPWRGPRP
jgi:hypothetical protein